MKRGTVAVIAAGVVGFAAAAGATDVRIGGARGGSIHSLAVDDVDGTVWAAVNGVGLYKSTDDGVAWIGLPLPTVSAHFPGDLLAGNAFIPGGALVCDAAPSEAAVWRTSNGGASFRNVLPFTAGNCTALGQAQTSAFAGIANGSGASGTGSLYQSDDFGLTWSPLGLSLPGEGVSVVSRLASGRIVIGTRALGASGSFAGAPLTGHVYYSDDGTSFTKVASVGGGAVVGLARKGGALIEIATTDGTDTRVWSTTDGAAWTLVHTENVATDLTAQALHYHAGYDRFFLLARDRLVSSSNGAASYAWPPAPYDFAAGLSTAPALSTDAHTAFAVTTSGALIVGDFGGDGLFRLPAGSGTWEVSNEGLYSPPVTIAMKARPAGYRYAGNLSGFVFASTNGLGAFHTIFRSTDLTHDAVRALAYDVRDPRRLFVASSNLNDFHELKRADDVGAIGDDVYPFTHAGWTSMAYPPVAATTHVMALLVDGSNLYAGLAAMNTTVPGANLLISHDGGGTWAASPLSVVGVRSLAFQPGDTQVIYAGAGDYRSLSSIDVANAGGLWRTTNGGVSWAQLGASTGLANETPATISIDPANPQRIWVFTDKIDPASSGDHDLWESLDGGATWTDITPGPTSIAANARFAMAYTSSAGLLVLASGGVPNMYLEHPGDGPDGWMPSFSVYGEGQTLYDGSVGIGSGTGLFEATQLTIGSLPGPGGSGKHGCGCSLDAAAGAMAGPALLAALAALLVLGWRAIFTAETRRIHSGK